MKISLVACAFLIVASAAAVAALPAEPYVGLFADEVHGSTSVNVPAFTPFQLWIWWLPSVHGLMSTEFRVTIPANAVLSSTAQNPLLQVILDCPPQGESYVCAYFSSCMAEWVWTHRLTCMLTAPAPGLIEILPRSGESVIWAADCEAGYPLEPVTILNKFGINQDGIIAVEPQSWGAIKSLYR